MGYDWRASRLGLFVAAVLWIGSSGCSRVVEPELPVTWKTEVGPLLTSRCSSCHSGRTPSGAYSTTSYQEVLGVGSDTVRNAVAGDESSRLLTILEGDHLTYLGEGAVGEERKATLHRWIVEDALAYFWSAAHPPTIQDPASEEFHGTVAASLGWTMETCRSCHGSDYRGGVTDAACTSCHQNTPEACDTCHGSDQSAAPPRPVYPDHTEGAHVAHLQVLSGRFAAMACDTCHLVPTNLTAAGHIDNADGSAEVTFGGPALTGGATPTYDAATGTCTGTYCHAGRSSGATPSPDWNATGTFTGCDGCHGFPPTNIADGNPHPLSTGCAACHPATVDASGAIIDAAIHGNGTVEIRPGIAQCDGCHSDDTAPTPFQDTLGRTDPAVSPVGAHNLHAGPSSFHAEQTGSVGYSCDNCHVVPASLGELTHIDGGGAELNFGQVATAKSATPTWDPVTGTCADVYCHGALLEGGGNNPSPVWTDSGARLVCGSCHALPPTTVTSGGAPFAHPAATTCEGCHASVIDAGFNFIDLSLHINGTVDF